MDNSVLHRLNFSWNKLQRLTAYLSGILIFLFSLFVSSAEIQVNQLYQGGDQVRSSDIGLELTIPENWQGALPAGSSFFFIESAALQTTMMLYAERVSNAQLQHTMSQSIPLDADIVLVPIAGPENKGDLLIADYRIPARPELKARVFGRSGEHGLSIALITLTPQQNSASVWSIAKATASNIKFFQPQQASQSAEANGSWQEYMRGRYIARYYSGSGYHEKQELWLCSDGQFYTSGDSGGYGGGASGAFTNRGAGSWQVEGSLPGQGKLVLHFTPGGGQSHYSLNLNNDKLYLNDTHWLRGNNDYCR